MIVCREMSLRKGRGRRGADPPKGKDPAFLGPYRKTVRPVTTVERC